MLLVLDDNDFRRKDLLVKLRLKNVTVSCQPLKDYKFITKPLITAYINPSKEVISSICEGDGISVVAKNAEDIIFPDHIINIPLDNNLDKALENIYNDELSKGKTGELDIFGKVVIKDNEVGVAGKRVTFNDTEIKIIKLFYFSYKKKFTDTEASSYFRYLKNPEQNFAHSVSMINSKCKKVGKYVLIIRENGVFFANPQLCSMKKTQSTSQDPNVIIFKNEKVHY